MEKTVRVIINASTFLSLFMVVDAPFFITPRASGPSQGLRRPFAFSRTRMLRPYLSNVLWIQGLNAPRVCALAAGGKSPCIVAEDCDIPRTAKRLTPSKFLNAGQTLLFDLPLRFPPHARQGPETAPAYAPLKPRRLGGGLFLEKP